MKIMFIALGTLVIVGAVGLIVCAVNIIKIALEK